LNHNALNKTEKKIWLGSLIEQLVLFVSKRHSLAISTVSNWISLAVNTIISILLTPYIISHLGKDGYGIWVLVLSIVGYYGFLDMGLHSATIRYVARYTEQKDNVSVNEVVSTSLLIFLAIGLIVASLSFLLSEPLAKFFQLSGEKSISFIRMIWLVGLAAGLGFPRRLFDAVLMAQEQFVMSNFLAVALMITRALAMIGVLYWGYGIESIGWVELLIEIFNITIKFLICQIQTNGVRYSFSGANMRTAKELFGFASLTFIALVGDTLRWNVDILVIGRFLSLEAVGIYGVASVLVKLLLRVSSTVSISTYPRLSSLAAGNLDTFRSKYRQYSQVTALVVVGMAVEIILLSQDFITLWVGIGFKNAIPVAIILTIALSLDYIVCVGINAVKALNEQALYATQTILEGVANLILSVLLVGHFGLIGIALGTAIPMVITKIFIQPIYTSKIIGVRWLNYFLETILAPLCLGCAVILLFYVSGVFAISSSFVMLGLKGSAIGIVYAISVLVFFRYVRENILFCKQFGKIIAAYISSIMSAK